MHIGLSYYFRLGGYLEAPSIGWQLFALDSSQRDWKAFVASLDTYDTRLLPEALSWTGEKVVIPGLVAGRTLARWYEHFSLVLPLQGDGTPQPHLELINATTVASRGY